MKIGSGYSMFTYEPNLILLRAASNSNTREWNVTKKGRLVFLRYQFDWGLLSLVHHGWLAIITVALTSFPVETNIS